MHIDIQILKLQCIFVEMKKKIRAKFREQKQKVKHYRHPVFDQYSHPKESRNSEINQLRVQRYNPVMGLDGSRKRNAYYRYESNPDVANDQSTSAEEDKKLLMTIVGKGHKVTGYNKASEYSKPYSKYSSRYKKTKKSYDWRSASYKNHGNIK